MARVYERLEYWVLPRQLEDVRLENTPQYDPYEDETQNKQSFPQLAEKLEHMSEVGDHYIGPEIQLSRGDQMAKGHVVVRSQDANGNVMGRSHTNPILDMRTYQVEFAGGNVTELTTNVIAESYTPNAIQMGMSTYSQMHWFIIKNITRPYPYQTNKSQYEADQ